MKSVYVAMSGGVDSSVAASLLVDAGRKVTGVTMILPQGVASGSAAIHDSTRTAQEVCDFLSIEHVVVDAREHFTTSVIDPYMVAYAHAMTPNPCVMCNRTVKFSWLLEHVSPDRDAVLATGHYASVVSSERGPRVGRATDRTKDQSYFLYPLSSDLLDSVEFPLEEMTKDQVREYAVDRGIPVATRPESQDVCFLAAGGHGDLMAQRFPESVASGDIVSLDGTVLGTHQGIANYTVGQRRGLGIGGPRGPLFVVRIDPDSNTIVVGSERDLEIDSIGADRSVIYVPDMTRVKAVIRYRMDPVPATVSSTSRGIRVDFSVPVRGVSPGQSVVCYQGDTIVAGGEILCTS